MSAVESALRERRLRALGVEPLHQRRPRAGAAEETPPVAPPPAVAAQPAVTVRAATAIRRLALQPDPAELRDPRIHEMYTALTEAVSKAGLQAVRPCDVAADPAAAVMVFGAALVPDGVPAVRVLREDPLAILCADRARKRRLWQRMQALGQGGGA